MRGVLSRAVLFASVTVMSSLIALQAAKADKIKHPVAVFSGLDKITGRIIAFEVATDETVQFGSLQITERVCYTRPATEAPQTTTFIEVDEVDAAHEYKRIFSGWMFAASPGLHGIEHPIYDIWLTGCSGGGETVAASPETSQAEPAPPPENAKPPAPKPTSRARRVQPQPAEDLGGEPPPDRGGGTSAQNRGPIEVGPPPGLNAPSFHAPSPNAPSPNAPSLNEPSPNEPSSDESGLIPPGLIPTGPGQRRAPARRYYPTDPADMPDAAGDGGF